MPASTATPGIIISGLSGSGKSVALQSLEDLGYYCIDNLPPVLLPELERHLRHDPQPFAGAAVSVDSRNKHFLALLDDHLGGLGAWRILFLEADEQTLLRRYSETRRKHPLTDAHTPLLDGIRDERKLLRPLQQRAAQVIDTTDLTPHELRALIRDFAAAPDAAGPLFLLESFGFKFGLPREADFVFDVRCLPNPHWQARLRGLTGLDRAVAQFLAAEPSVGQMTDQIHQFVSAWLPGFAAENRSYLTIAIGCTGGRHRSVYVAERLRDRFAGGGVRPRVRHRELAR